VTRNVHTEELAAVKIIKLEPGDDFSLIQPELLMVKECKYCNIIAYLGSYCCRILKDTEAVQQEAMFYCASTDSVDSCPKAEP
jgi:hypothetical protein